MRPITTLIAILCTTIPVPLLGEQTQPNIIFVLCDDLGYGDLGVTWQDKRQGDKKHITPNLDRFAAEGALLTRHYCPAPVCAPSRGSLLTGQHQGHCQIRNAQFDKALPDDHTLASTLRAIGYRTAIVGKYGLQGEGSDAASWPAYPTKLGFDDFLGLVRHRDGHVHYPAHEWPKGDSEGHREPKEVWYNDSEISSQMDKCFTSDLFTAFAKHWIAEGRKNAPDQPFFLYLAYDTPHAALQLPTSPYPEGGGLDGGVQWLGEEGKMINTALGTIDSWVHPDYDKPGWNDEEQRQATMIRRIDDHMADLVQLLKDLAIDQDTLIVFSSDNGPHSESYLDGGTYSPTSFQAYGPYDGIKRDVLEGGILTPTLVRWPTTISAGSKVTLPSQFHDWMTTFLAAAGAPLPAQADGVSLLPSLTGKGQQQPPTTYVEYQHHGKTPGYQDFIPQHRNRKRGEQQAIFLEGYKGLRRNIQSHQDRFAIFDLTKDPQEAEDLSQSSPKFKALEQRMRDHVLQIRMPNATAKRPYDGEAIPAIKNPPTGEAGLTTRFLAGQFPWVPRLAETPAATSGTSSGLLVPLPEPGAMELSGYLMVPRTGEYTFSLESEGSAVLRLHEALVIDADHPDGSGGSYRQKVRLAKGLHPLRLSCLANTTTPSLKWAGPEMEEQPIPDSVLLRK